MSVSVQLENPQVIKIIFLHITSSEASSVNNLITKPSHPFCNIDNSQD